MAGSPINFGSLFSTGLTSPLGLGGMPTSSNPYAPFLPDFNELNSNASTHSLFGFPDQFKHLSPFGQADSFLTPGLPQSSPTSFPASSSIVNQQNAVQGLEEMAQVLLNALKNREPNQSGSQTSSKSTPKDENDNKNLSPQPAKESKGQPTDNAFAKAVDNDKGDTPPPKTSSAPVVKEKPSTTEPKQQGSWQSDIQPQASKHRDDDDDDDDDRVKASNEGSSRDAKKWESANSTEQTNQRSSQESSEGAQKQGSRSKGKSNSINRSEGSDGPRRGSKSRRRRRGKARRSPEKGGQKRYHSRSEGKR